MEHQYNHFVLLQETDSTRRSIKEVELGQWAIFTEIVQYGHIVVLPFNQVTDSYTIMSMLLNEHSKDAVLELFRLGWLQVNAFGSKYTMADYIINAASKASEGDGKFLFSWLPVQKDETALLQLIKQAISSSNTAMFSPKENPSKEELWILNSEIEKMKREVSSSGLSPEELKALEKEVNTDYSRRMRDIGEFLSIMVQLSSAGPVIHQKKEINEIRYDYLSLINVILYNTNINWGAMEIDPARRNLILDARKQLQHLRDTSEEDEKKTKLKHQDNRSDWIDALIEIRDVYIESHTRPDVNCLKMANALVDLCYYYAVEESVLNVLKHFKESKLKGIDEQISGQELAYLNDNISRALFTPDEIDTIKKTKEDQNYARISSSAAKKIIKYVNASKLFQNENFIKDFAKRLNEYWDIHKECFLAPDTNSLMKYCSVRYRNIWDYRAIDLPESNEGILHTPDWNLALSLVNGQNPQQPNKIPEFTYEEQTKHFQKSWDRRRRLRYRSKIFSLLFTFMLITILTISETPLDMLAYGIFELDINKVPFFVRVLISVISAFVSSVFISLLSIAISLVMKKVEKIPFETTDILDFYKQIRRTICEVVTIKVLYKKKYRSYHL